MWEHPCVDCESNIFGERPVFVMDSCHISLQSVLAVVALIGDVFDAVVTRPCTGCWEEPSLYSGCHYPVRGRVYSLVVGIKAQRSSSKLQCKVGWTGALPLGRNSCIYHPRDHLLGMCNSVTLRTTCCVCPQSLLLLAPSWIHPHCGSEDKWLGCQL